MPGNGGACNRLTGCAFGCRDRGECCIFARFRHRHDGLDSCLFGLDVYSTLAHPVIMPQSIVETTRLRFRPDNPIATIPPLS